MGERKDLLNVVPRMQNIKAEELLARFRSKEDLYRYMTNQSKSYSPLLCALIVGLFLPSYSATKVVFLRAIVADQKKVLRQGRVTHLVVPKFEEISVKSLYAECLADPIVGPYLPTTE